MLATLRLLCSLCLAVSLLSCSSSEDYLKLSGSTMGTTYHITYHGSSKNAQHIQQGISQRLIELNQHLSTYIDNSDLMQLNNDHSGRCVPVTSDTAQVVAGALKINQLSDGAFNPGLGPLIELWGFDRKDTGHKIPEPKSIQDALSQIRFESTLVDMSVPCITKSSPELFINLSAIAKGYGVDELASFIESQGVESYMIEVGGELRMRGQSPRGTPWNIAIESPISEARTVQKIINPDIMGVATSGDYRNYFEKDGKRYSHTIDPTTGYPIEHSLVSVTVLAPSAMEADGLATAFMVLGEARSMEIAKQQNIAAFFIQKSSDGFVESFSPSFEPYLKK